MILSSCMINNSWRECQKRKDDRLRVQNTRACRFDVLNTIKGIIFSAVNVAVWTDIGNCPYRLVFTCLQLKLELTCIVQANDPPWAERCECTHLPDCIKILTHMHKCMYTHNKKTTHTHARTGGEWCPNEALRGPAGLSVRLLHADTWLTTALSYFCLFRSV